MDVNTAISILSNCDSDATVIISPSGAIQIRYFIYEVFVAQ